MSLADYDIPFYAILPVMKYGPRHCWPAFRPLVKTTNIVLVIKKTIYILENIKNRIKANMGLVIPSLRDNHC